jgi:predicted dienelactone hydrolase
MRIFEWLLIAVIGITLLLRFVRLQKFPWVNLFPLFGLLVLGYHYFLEGMRWQMVPLYLLALWMIPNGVRQVMRPSDEPQIAWTLLGLALLPIMSIAPIALPVPQFPEPRGIYGVGTTTLYWVDEEREEVYASTPGSPRRVMAQVWYPIGADTTGELAPYLPDGKLDAQILASSYGFPSWFLEHFLLAKTNAIMDAPLATCLDSWPVLIFSHGWNGFRYQNTTQMEELASQGYIVFAPEHAYGALLSMYPDGSVAFNKPEALPSGVSDEEYDQAARILGQSWVGDIRFTLDQIELMQSGTLVSIFNGKLNLEQIGLMGHSTGGGAVLEVCQMDERCKAVLAQDPWLVPYDRQMTIQAYLKPQLSIFSERWKSEKNLPLLQSFWESQSNGKQRITISGTSHYDFTDLPVFSPIANVIGLKGPITASREIPLINDTLLGFFEHNLLNKDSTRLQQAFSTYPELLIETR